MTEEHAVPRNLIAVPTDHRSFTHLFRVPICPPLLRTAATAVIAMNVDGAVGFTGRASISGGITKCRMAKCLLPRPSPLHTVEDVAALLSACNEATAALVAGDLKAAARLALPVVGGPFENPATDLPRLLKATHAWLEAYIGAHKNMHFFVENSDQAFKKAEGESDVAVAVRWMAAEAERCGCSDFVLFGGTSWWVQLVDALGIELTEQERDVLLPTKLTNVTPPGSDKPIELPLVPPPCSARFVQIVLPEFAAGVKAGTGKNRGRWEASKASGRDVTGSGNTSGRAGSDEASTQASKATAAWTTPGKLRLPSEIEAMALGDAFAANALKFNPAPWDPGSSGLSKEAYYRRMADENVYSTY
mmetsp:Transcript_64427/g.178532  ORF Transcript_64427/g.178532 Transcript_64427/m.178532 type:complete len:361 (-) Transcript_64427:559-1641(-)